MSVLISGDTVEVTRRQGEEVVKDEVRLRLGTDRDGEREAGLLHPIYEPREDVVAVRNRGRCQVAAAGVAGSERESVGLAARSTYLDLVLTLLVHPFLARVLGHKFLHRPGKQRITLFTRL